MIACKKTCSRVCYRTLKETLLYTFFKSAKGYSTNAKQIQQKPWPQLFVARKHQLLSCEAVLGDLPATRRWIRIGSVDMIIPYWHHLASIMNRSFIFLMECSGWFLSCGSNLKRDVQRLHQHVLMWNRFGRKIMREQTEVPFMMIMRDHRNCNWSAQHNHVSSNFCWSEAPASTFRNWTRRPSCKKYSQYVTVIVWQWKQNFGLLVILLWVVPKHKYHTHPLRPVNWTNFATLVKAEQKEYSTNLYTVQTFKFYQILIWGTTSAQSRVYTPQT